MSVTNKSTCPPKSDNSGAAPLSFCNQKGGYERLVDGTLLRPGIVAMRTRTVGMVQGMLRLAIKNINTHLYTLMYQIKHLAEIARCFIAI